MSDVTVNHHLSQNILAQTALGTPELTHFNSFSERWSHIVKTYPTRIALENNNKITSYRALDDLVAIIRKRLLNWIPDGGKCNIGIFGSCSYQSLSAQLASYCTGCIYTTLNPEWTEDTLLSALYDSQVDIIINCSDDSLPVASVISFESLLANEINLDASHIAIVNYMSGSLFKTSGSTGKNKWVLFPAYCLLQDIKRQTNTLHISAEDRFDLLFEPSFSASLAPIFGALLNGATLCVVDLHMLGVARLWPWITTHSITISTMSASTLKAMMPASKATHLDPKLRLISTGGEPLTYQDAEHFFRNIYSRCTIQNAYATTETRTISEWFLTHETSIEKGVVCVGIPVEGKQVKIINHAGREVTTTGKIGEITVASDYIPKDYYAGSKNKLFIYSESTKKYVFHTGDLGYFDTLGRLHLVGRQDDLIKLRGKRFSLTEIELCIRQLSIVSIYKLEWVSHKLVLFVQGDLQHKSIELHRHLNARLPEHFRPIYIHMIQAMPYTHTGKIDRPCLREAYLQNNQQKHIETNCDYFEYSAFKQKLYKIIAQQLDIYTFEADDNFFQHLGMNSLQTAELIFKLEAVLNQQISLSILHSHPTLNALSTYFQKNADPSKHITLSKIQACDNPRAYVVHFAWHGESPEWSSILRQHISNDYGIYCLHFKLKNATGQAYISLNELAKSCSEVIQDELAGYRVYLSGYSFSGLVAYETAACLNHKNNHMYHAILVDTHTYARKKKWQLFYNDILSLKTRLVILLSPEKRKQYGYTIAKLLARYKIMPYISNAKHNPYRLLVNNVSDDAMGYALSGYSPSLFDGDMTLIQAELDMDVSKISNFLLSFAWDEYVKGDVKRHKIVNSQHTDIMKRHAHQVAEIISTTLIL
ncbi:MAG: non-ribosomal peptide synthetase [Legionella sp.]|nr:non-ribosomal peptide synthetase [Legionella sp.]